MEDAAVEKAALEQADALLESAQDATRGGTTVLPIRQAIRKRLSEITAMTPTTTTPPPVEKKFGVGDTVKLASGGPDMTVISYDVPQGTQGFCLVNWFEPNTRPNLPPVTRKARLPQNALVLVKKAGA